MNFEVMETTLLPKEWDRKVLKIKGEELLSSRCDFSTLKFIISRFTTYAGRIPFDLTPYTLESVQRVVSGILCDKRALIVGWKEVQAKQETFMVGTVAVFNEIRNEILIEYQQPLSTVLGSQENRPYSIAIDGPAAAGKSTVAKRMAADYGLVYIDTGAMYRAVGLACIEAGISCNDEEEVNQFLPSITVTIVNDGGQKIMLNNTDVTDKIRTNEVSMAASDVSKHSEVRKKLVSLQQSMAANGKVIMDGRDIGTVVIPNANLKIFLTADVEERARRRYEELRTKGDTSTLEEVLDDLKTRDYNDSTRDNSPLKPAFDSFHIDSTNMTVEEVERKIVMIMTKLS